MKCMIYFYALSVGFIIPTSAQLTIKVENNTNEKIACDIDTLSNGYTGTGNPLIIDQGAKESRTYPKLGQGRQYRVKCWTKNVAVVGENTFKLNHNNTIKVRYNPDKSALLLELKEIASQRIIPAPPPQPGVGKFPKAPSQAQQEITVRRVSKPREKPKDIGYMFEQIQKRRGALEESDPDLGVEEFD